MFYPKIHLLVTIITTQLTALLFGKLPYFPIEISRTAASCDEANTVLRTGFVSLIATLYLSNNLTYVTFMLWIGLILVSIPDKINMILHLLGVFIVFVAATFYVWQNYTITVLYILVAGITIFILRVVFKVLAILIYDNDIQNMITAVWKIPFDKKIIVLVIKKNNLIMFEGESGYVHNMKDKNMWQIILPVFKLCGVLQWVVFFMISFIF